jgi:transposase
MRLVYPTDEQIERLDWTLARCCELYNAVLQERKDAWNACKKHPNFYDAAWREEHAKEYSVCFAEQCRWLPMIRNAIRPEYQQIGSHVLQNVLHRVDNAFAHFFRRVKCGQTPGHRKVRRQRQDFHHKQSRLLVDCYETIVFENLKPANMSRRPQPKQDSDGKFLPNGAAAKGGLNKSLHDAGWSSFIAMVRAKAESAGHTTVLLVNPKDTSQICSGCLKKGPHKDLNEHTHTCPHCALVLDRDVNAAVNILRLGLSHQAA